MGFHISNHVFVVKNTVFHHSHFFSSLPSTMRKLLRRHSATIGPHPPPPYTPIPSQYVTCTPWVPPYHRMYRLVLIFHSISSQPPPNLYRWCVIFHPIFIPYHILMGNITNNPLQTAYISSNGAVIDGITCSGVLDGRSSSFSLYNLQNFIRRRYELVHFYAPQRV